MAFQSGEETGVLPLRYSLSSTIEDADVVATTPCPRKIHKPTACRIDTLRSTDVGRHRYLLLHDVRRLLVIDDIP